jgi:hypothetical protein
MKIELQLSGITGKKVCPVTRKEFTDSGPYSFIITGGKYAGMSIDPKVAIKKGFTMSYELFRQILRDYGLAREQKHMLEWDPYTKRRIAELIRTDIQEINNDPPDFIIDKATGAGRHDPFFKERQKAKYNALKDVLDYCNTPENKKA